MTVSLHRIEVFRRREDPDDLRGIRVWIMSRHAAVVLRQILDFRAVKGALGGYERQIEGKAMHNGQSYEAWYGKELRQLEINAGVTRIGEFAEKVDIMQV